MPGMLEIDHVMLLMLENRSFDHLLGALTLEGRSDVDGIPTPRKTNPAIDGTPIPMRQLETATGPIAIDGKRYLDPPHEYEEVAAQLNGQAMDGFVRSYERKYKRRKKDLAPRSGQDILARMPEPGFHLASSDIAVAAASQPTDLESHLRALNIMREMERLR